MSLFMVGKIYWRRDRLPTPVFLGFPCGSTGKESACNVEDLGSIPGLGRSLGEGEGYSLQYSGLENSLYSPWGCKESDMTKWLSLLPFYWGFPDGSVIKNPPANAGHTGDSGLIPRLGRCPGEGKSYPFQYSGLENFMDCMLLLSRFSPVRLCATP